jgi:hypothetical protein
MSQSAEPQPAAEGDVPSSAPAVPSAATPSPTERVGLGLAAATAAVLASAVVAVALWNFGFVASITALLLSVGASIAYTKAAGTSPRRGIAPLVALIALGVVGTAVAFVGWDASQYYGEHAAEAAASGVSRASFVWQNITDGQVLSAYAGDLAFYFLFAVLGTFGVMRRLLRRPA